MNIDVHFSQLYRHVYFMTPETESNTLHSAGILREISGLTYRQLNDWDQKIGLLSQRREKDEGWRKFTTEEVIAVAIVKRLRDELSLPLERIGQIYRWLLDATDDRAAMTSVLKAAEHLGRIEESIPDDDALRIHMEHKGIRGEKAHAYRKNFIFMMVESLRDQPIVFAVKACEWQDAYPYLFSTLEQSVIFREEEVPGVYAKRMFTPVSTVVLPLKPVFDDVLEKLNYPSLPDTKSKIVVNRSYQTKTRITSQEEEVLKIIRNGECVKATIYLTDGKVISADYDEIVEPQRDELDSHLLDKIASPKFGAITVKKADGRVVRVIKTTKIKFPNSVTGKP